MNTNEPFADWDETKAEANAMTDTYQESLGRMHHAGAVIDLLEGTLAAEANGELRLSQPTLDELNRQLRLAREEHVRAVCNYLKS